MIFYKKALKFTELMFGNKRKEKPTPLSKKDKKFITRMVKDELRELKEAKTLIDDMDAYCDIIYYLYTHACSKGINLDPLLDIVHKSNMTKFVNGKAIRRKSDGKVIKPENFVTPEPMIEKELERQMKGFSFWGFLLNKIK